MKKGTSLVIQWLALYAPSAGDQGSVPGLGTRSCMPQLKEILCATTKTGAAKIFYMKKLMSLKHVPSIKKCKLQKKMYKCMCICMHTYTEKMSPKGCTSKC